MADRILGRLRKNMHDRKKEISISSDADIRLMDIVRSTEGKPLSNRDYLLLMTMVYELYRRQGRSPSSLQYILLRMQQVERAQRHKESRVLFPLIVEYNPEPLDEVELFLARKRPVLAGLRRKLWQNGILAGCGLFTILLPALSLAAGWNFFLSLFLSLAVLGGFLLLWEKVLMPRLVQKEIARLGRRLDPDLYAFEDAFVLGGLPPRRRHHI